MSDHDPTVAAATAWIKEFPAAITVCDRDATIIAMNERAGATFSKSGGLALLGKSLFSCHPEKANAIIRDLIATGKSNTYTIEKAGQKKLIHQAPWYLDGQVAGLVEMSLPLPHEMPHFVRPG